MRSGEKRGFVVVSARLRTLRSIGAGPLRFVPVLIRLCSRLGAHTSTMTARAFLGLSDELREAFAKAQDDETLRYLHVKIVDEDTLTRVGSKQKGGDLSTDFDGLGQVRWNPVGYSSSLRLNRSSGEKSTRSRRTTYLTASCQQIFSAHQQLVRSDQFRRFRSPLRIAVLLHTDEYTRRETS